MSEVQKRTPRKNLETQTAPGNFQWKLTGVKQFLSRLRQYSVTYRILSATRRSPSLPTGYSRKAIMRNIPKCSLFLPRNAKNTGMGSRSGLFRVILPNTASLTLTRYLNSDLVASATRLTAIGRSKLLHSLFYSIFWQTHPLIIIRQS